MTDQSKASRNTAIAIAAACVGVALLGVGGYTLMAKPISARSANLQAADLSSYNGVWVDDQGRWIQLMFKGEQGLMLAQGVEVRFQLTSRDKAAVADTFQAREGITGTVSTAVLVAQATQPRRLLLSTDGSTTAFTYLKALTPAEVTELQTRLATKGTTMLEKLSPDATAPPASTSAALAGTQTLSLLGAADRKDGLERQLTTDGYESIQCVMGADAPLSIEDGRYATSTAQAPPACGTTTSGAFVLDTKTGRAAALVDVSQGGEDLQERQFGDPELITWLQGRYADGE
jgi:hypothetical protein